MEAGSSGQRSHWLRFVKRLHRPFLTQAEKARIVSAVAEQEQRTTGRIHVYVKAYSGTKDILALARRRFATLGLHRSADHNNVLILISHLDRRFAIWGGEAVHSKAGHDLWDRARDVLAARLAAGRNAEGIEACIRKVGDELAHHFPRSEGNIREQKMIG